MIYFTSIASCSIPMHAVLTEENKELRQQIETLTKEQSRKTGLVHSAQKNAGWFHLISLNYMRLLTRDVTC